MEGCDSRSARSISPTERSDESSRLRMARRLGSATMANDDGTTHIYPNGYMLVKSYSGRDVGSVQQPAAAAVSGARLEAALAQQLAGAGPDVAGLRAAALG